MIVFPRNGVSDKDLHRFFTAYTPRRCRVRRTVEGYQNGGTLEGVKVLMQLDVYLGQRTTNEDRRRVAAWLRTSGLASSVRDLPR